MNSPEPAGGDGSEPSCLLIGLEARPEGPGKQPPRETVPETDTGGLAEHAKALERTMLKELGKLPP